MRKTTIKINKMNKHAISTALATALIAGMASHSVMADDFYESMTSGDGYIKFNLRYEGVDQDNTLENASALTLRTLLGYETGDYRGFSAKFEMDQGYIQYKNDVLTAKLGRQVITLDGHRFVGHVGWRQDWQTFDALSAKYTPNKDLTVSYAYITQRNRIFAEAADLDAKDHLINLSYKTSVGKLVGYSYLLEVDNDTDNALDTYGISFTGSTKAGDTKVLYAAEYATQISESATTNYDADYLKLEGGAVISGITAKLGYEVLGSDDGAYGFSTPLATLHKFNGWSDQFLGTPSQGLVDAYVSVGAKLGGGGLTVIYHGFEADEADDTVDDLGSELNVSYVKKFRKNYVAGVKYAASAGDIKVDADKLWVWVGANF